MLKHTSILILFW